MNQLLPEIKNRKSVRKYRPDPVSQEDILLIIEAARLCASGNNSQPWRYIVIRDEETKRRIVAADHEQNWMLSAPVFIACLADLSCRVETLLGEELLEEDPSWDLKRVIRDSAISITQMMLQAEHMGLGSCWTGWYSQHEMREVLGVAPHMWISGILTLGYPDHIPSERKKLPAEAIVTFR